MGTWERLTGAGRKFLRGAERAPEPPAEAQMEEEPDPPSFATPPAPPPECAPPSRGLSGWLENKAQRVIEQAYAARAHDIEERAMRTMTSFYKHTADDLEKRAVRAMRAALENEAERIKDAIEHGIEVKKREVRLSLLVLVVSSLVYLALYWFTHRPGRAVIEPYAMVRGVTITLGVAWTVRGIVRAVRYAKDWEEELVPLGFDKRWLRRQVTIAVLRTTVLDPVNLGLMLLLVTLWTAPRLSGWSG